MSVGTRTAEAGREPALKGGTMGEGARREERTAYLFLLPWFAGLLLFLVIPLFWALYISLTDRRLLRRGTFQGLDNYIYMFTQDAQFYKALSVTGRWLLLTTPLFLVAGLLLSLLLNQRLRGMYFFRTIFYIPSVLSVVAVTILWFVLLNGELGAVNQVLRTVGWDNPPYWFDEPAWALPGLAIAGLWGVGGNAIIYLAGLQNIPPQLYEAASIDGAGPWRKFRSITLPMLSSTIFFLLVNTVVDGTLVFGSAYIIAGGGGGGGPDNSLLFYMLYLYRRAFTQGLVGYGAALAWILTIFGCLIVWILFRFEKRFVYYETQ